MYISEHADAPDAIIATVIASPAVRKSPNVETALKEAAKVAEKSFKANLAAKVNDEMTDLVDGFTLINGDWSTDMAETQGIQAKSDFESALDDIVETYTEPYTDLLSANWLGLHTIESGVWLPDGPQAFANNFAKEVYKVIASDKTPAQMLASAGITGQMLQEALDNKDQNDMNAPASTEGYEVKQALKKIKAHLGDGFDVVDVYSDLDLIATEDDDILVNAAGARLGLDEDGVGALQMDVIDTESDDHAQTWCDILLNLDAKPKRNRDRKAEASRVAAKAENTMSLEVLTNLKHCGAGDTAMAEALGISRSTYTNYFKGKSDFSPDGDQYAVLRREVVERANKMLTALGYLDGITHDPVV